MAARRMKKSITSFNRYPRVKKGKQPAGSFPFAA